ncbi:MAG: HlyD family efflux transporter periplasmic adaptor subunit, partial [Planctomycetia bacterium]|nr:HlyD family efflux transporter periplasmic adaptor subunit [Planctomycetia bacterium]
EVAGVLKQVHVREGQAVAAGTILAELENIDARLEEAKLRGQVVELRQKLLALRRQQLERDRPGQEAEQQVSATEEELQSAEKQLIQRQQNLTRLVLRSPRAGTVLPPPLVKGAPHTEGGLAGWSGTPLERHNEGTWLPAGQLLCQVGDPARMEAVVVIDQSDLPFVQTGQSVLLKVDELAGRTIPGQIADIAQVSLKSSSPRLSAKQGGGLDTRTDATTGQEKPASPSYQLRVPLDNPDGLLRPGLRGEARMQANYETLFTKLWRFVLQTFYFKL